MLCLSKERVKRPRVMKATGPTADGIDNHTTPLDKWPTDVVLYQPYQVEQITLPDAAQCLAVEAFLRMSGLVFRLEQRKNAADMSPTSKLPFIQAGELLVSEFEPIVAYVESKGFSLCNDLPPQATTEIRAYTSMMENTLSNAEHYVAWLVPEIAAEVTKPRYGCPHPWPLNWLLPWLRQREVRQFLSVQDWTSKSIDDVVTEVKLCLEALSEKLDTNKFFMGPKPTELDALVFGHIYTLQTTKLPGAPLSQVVVKYDNLIQFCKRIEATFFF